MQYRVLTIIMATVILQAASMRGADLFQIDVDPNPAFPNGRQVGGDSIRELVEDFIDSSGEFSGLQTVDNFSSGATYWGVPDAVGFVVDDNTDQGGQVFAQLNSRVIDLQESFTGPTREDVREQIIDWLEQEGVSKLMELDAAISKRSAAAPNDGNPFATTAQMAGDSFSRFGLRARPGRGRRQASRGGNDGAKQSQRPAGARAFRFGVGGGVSYTTADLGTPVGELDADKINIPLEASYGSERVSVEASLPLSLTEIEGTEIYGIGLQLGVPWRVKMPSDGSPWGWTVTPQGGILGRGTEEGLNGALIYNVGLVNRFDYELNEHWVVSYGNQIGTFHDIGFKIGNVDIDRDIDQRILKNGIQVAREMGQWEVAAHVIDSRFLEDAAVDDFQNYGASAVYSFTPSFYASLALDYIDGNQFEAFRAGLSSSFRF